MSIWTLVIATAIPVVMFALWKEYFEQDWNQREPGPAEPEREQGEAASAVARIRLAGLLSTTLQLIIFLSTAAIRREVPGADLWGLWITLAGLVFQRLQQSALEQKVLASIEGTEAPGKIVSIARSPVAGSMLWALAGVVVYLGLLGGTLMATAVLIAVFKWTGAKAMGALLLGTLLGYTLALASNFALSPWFIKRILPGNELGEGPARQQIEKWFAEAKVPLPELRMTATARVPGAGGPANAWVTGLAWLRGPLRPVLWMTPALLVQLSPDELEAVIKHEIVHLKRNHLTQRFALAWAMSLLVLLTLSGALALSAWLPTEQGGSLLPVFSLLLAASLVWGSFKAIEDQSRGHELEADLLCILELGVSASSLVSALKRVSRINGPDAGPSHPTLEIRLAALEGLVRREQGAGKDNNSKAA